MAFKTIKVPSNGEKITMGSDGKLRVPDQPIIPYIEGDGTGPDIWRASQYVFDNAVKKLYGGKRQIAANISVLPLGRRMQNQRGTQV